METCITQVKTELQITQFLSEEVFCTYSSVHTRDEILPIEVAYKKAISSDILLVEQGLSLRTGESILQREGLLDALSCGSLVVLRFADRVAQFSLNTREETLLHAGHIFDIQLSYPKLAIESNFYYVMDLKAKSCVRVGNTEKSKKFGCAFHDQFIFCGRPNGVIWKASVETGVVAVSYKFEKMRIQQLSVLNGAFLVNATQDQLTIISMEDMSLFRTVELQHSVILFQANRIIYFQQGCICTLEVLGAQAAFDKYAEQRDARARELFSRHQEIQNYGNALKLAKSVDCGAMRESVNRILQSKLNFSKVEIQKVNLQRPENRELPLKPPRTVVKWLEGLKPTVSHASQSIAAVLQNAQQLLKRKKQVERIEGALGMSLLRLRQLRVGVVHELVLGKLRRLKRIGLEPIQMLVSEKYCRNLLLENQYLRELASWLMKEREMKIRCRLKSVWLIVR